MGDSQTLYSHLDEQQANEVSAALLRANINADKRQADRATDWSVLVAKRDLPSAMAILDATGLPHNVHSSMGEVFKKEGFVASPTEDKARYQFALSEELSSTLQENRRRGQRTRACRAAGSRPDRRQGRLRIGVGGDRDRTWRARAGSRDRHQGDRQGPRSKASTIRIG